ncbi:MAG: hypothetical protein EPGJADBJ_03695 [Saprospiraceae bacterium]|nr:hypothetical protein [Saprospiraceae bacterium]
MLAPHPAAQTTAVRFEPLAVQDALPPATIDCIYEDSRGFLWIGSYAGLYLFDGYGLTHFYQDPNDPLSISDNKIRKLLEDKHGNLWVGTQVGLNYFDVRKRVFRRWTDKSKNGIGDIEIHDLKCDQEGLLWVAASDGLYKLVEGRGKFEKVFPSGDKTAATPVHAIEPTDQGIYICSPPGFYFLDFDTKATSVISAKALFYGQSTNEKAAIQKDCNNNIWIGTSHGLFQYKLLRHPAMLEEPFYRNDTINFIIPVKGCHEFFIGTYKGLSVLNPQTHQVQNIALPSSACGEPIKEGFYQGFLASSGILWLSTTSTNQIFKATRNRRFQQTPLNLVDQLKGAARRLFELYEYSPDVLLVPHSGGAAFLDLKTQQINPFPYKPNYNLAGWQDGVICFLEEKDGQLWIGTVGGLFLFDKIKKRFIHLEKRFDGFSKLRGITIRKILRDSKNNLWVATWNQGIFKINVEARTISQYNHWAADNARNISNTRSVLETRDGDVWVGTRGGLLQYVENADSFRVYKHIPGHPETMSENTAFCIYEASDGTIWCGTYGGGLNQLNPQTGKFRHFTTKDGLKNNNVFSLLPDTKGNLWLMGFDGLSKFTLTTESFQTYTRQHGLLNKEFNAFIYGKSGYSGRLFFGGKDGIDSFDPDSVQLSAHDPNVFITHFRLFNETVPIARSDEAASRFSLREDISFSQNLMLEYSQNVISFDFVALDYAAPAAIQYAYQLVGFDKDWQYVGNKRSVTFTNLDPGAYVFQVKATNGDGVWGSKMASLAITVLPPWWRTWWFLSLALLAVAGLLAAFYRYRIRQIKEREAVNQRITEVKMEALRTQMNPHFIFNCLSSLKSYAENGESEKASRHISKFATLLRQVLEQSKSDTITLAEELDTLQRYVELEQMRYKNFDFQPDIQPGVLEEDIKIPPLMVQPYVENAIWHGLKHKKNGTGKLLLQVEARNGECRITVEDNGVGRAASQKMREKNQTAHHSHGLNVTAERMALFGHKYGNHAGIEITDLYDDNSEARGTRVTLYFKIQQFD